METIATSRKSQISVPARAFHPMLRMMFIADFPIYVIVHSRPMWYPCSTGFLPRMPTSSYLSSSIHFSFLFYSPWIKSLPPFSESTNFSIRALIGASEDLFSAIDTIFEFQHNCPPQASRKSCKCPWLPFTIEFWWFASTVGKVLSVTTRIFCTFESGCACRKLSRTLSAIIVGAWSLGKEYGGGSTPAMCSIVSLSSNNSKFRSELYFSCLIKSCMALSKISILFPQPGISLRRMVAIRWLASRPINLKICRRLWGESK